MIWLLSIGIISGMITRLALACLKVASRADKQAKKARKIIEADRNMTNKQQ